MHAQILRSLLNHGFIQLVPAWLVTLLTAVVCLSWFGHGLRKNLIYWSLFALLPLLGLYALWLGHAVPPAALLVSAKLAYAARQALEGMRQRHQRKRITEAFAGHVDTRLLRKIVAADGRDAALEPRRQPLTALWLRLPESDWRSANPETVARDLARCYTAVRAAVERAGGMIERFHGDRVLVYFGAPIAARNAPRAALEAALAMARADLPGAGLGISSGEVLAGQVTLAGASPYVVLGDVVDRAAELAEAAAADTAGASPARVYVDAATARAVEGRALDAIDLNGREAYILTAR
jgi:class 3 adenylate cyclase